MSLDARREALIRRNVRSVAVDAERHWWVSRLQQLVAEWEADHARCAEQVQALIQARERRLDGA